jgi:hypothetical protein
MWAHILQFALKWLISSSMYVFLAVTYTMFSRIVAKASTSFARPQTIRTFTSTRMLRSEETPADVTVCC